VGHYLNGNIEIKYKNNAPDTLKELYIHLWPNAYSNKSSAFSKQQIEIGATEFYFAPDSLLGNIDQLDFYINKIKVPWKFSKEHSDIAILTLNEGIKPGESILLTTPFSVKIPAVFSRMGHSEGSYQISQWYPKPAVYDIKGWHPMPYLDIGEFYSEFGDYTVNISIPEKYIVAATGVLQTQSEIENLENRILNSKNYLSETIDLNEWRNRNKKNSSKKKTIQFKANNVHDFAWFAYPDFIVEKRELLLGSGKIVDAFTFFPPEAKEMWSGAINYVADATYFYSEHVGEYPYPQVSAIRSKISAGGGMEYPMVTVIDKMPAPTALDGVIAHEVGHNWFYGSLASNERDHPWMDEGINTFYEQKYLKQKYNGQDPYHYFIPGLLSDNDLELHTPHYFYLLQARRKFEQPSGLSSDVYTPINYALAAYQKPALALGHLESYLGEGVFKTIMQKYYSTWKGRHPQPNDFEEIISSSTSVELDWFFEDLLNSNRQLDYKIKSIEGKAGNYRITLENKGDIAAPIELSFVKDNAKIGSIWVEGFDGTKKIEVQQDNVDVFALDFEYKTLDIQRKNNYARVSGILAKSREPEVRLWSTTENSRKSRINITPVLGGNAYDKFMLGAWIFNPIFPENKFHYSIIPLYAFGTKDLTGLAHFQYSIFPDSDLFSRIKLGTSIKAFNYDRNKDIDLELGYRRISPSISFDFAVDQKKTRKSQLRYTTHFINEDFANFSSVDSFDIINENSVLHRLQYSYERNLTLNPWKINIIAEQQSYTSIDGEDQDYLKLSGILQTYFKYKHNKSFDLRIFASFFPLNSQRETANYNKRIARGSIALMHQGFNDYAYDDILMGRSEQSGIWSKQVNTHRDGGFKNALSSRYSIGQSNDFAIAINMKADLPLNIPIIRLLKPYLDLGYYNKKETSSADFKGSFLYSGGFMIDFPEDVMSIHFPLFYSNEIKTAYNDLGGFGARISFHLNLNKFNPYTILRDIH
jgi:hypothetical protein